MMDITADTLKGAVITDVSQLSESMVTVTCTNGAEVVLDLWNYYWK